MTEARNFQFGDRHFVFAFKKNAGFDFRYIDRIQNNHKLLSAETSAQNVKRYFIVLTKLG